MRRFLHISFILLLSVSALSAQPRLVTPEYYFGVQGGVMASMMHFSPSISQSAKHPHLGGNAGFVFRYAGHKYCALQLELNWMERGWYETDIDYDRTQHYIEIPMLFHLYFGRQVRGFLNLGPQIGWCVAEYDNGNAPAEEHQYLKLDKPFDWGVAGGLGLYGRTVAGTWQLEARFNYSLGDIYKNSKADWFSRSAPMNLSLNLAWLWEFKK